MVAGHLQEKKGLFYIVLSYKDASGRRRTKWISTGLPIKGNKKRAEKLLMEARNDFVVEEQPEVVASTFSRDMLFSDFMLKWLEIVKPTIQLVTYSSYCNMVKGVIVPYFKETGVTLGGLKAIDIQTFYAEQLERVKANSVIHYHANIHKALKYAVKNDLLDSNPADKVERPKKERFIGGFYDNDELNRLFEAASGTQLELPILFGAFYGLRRSEVLGLKWDAIDLKNDTITIRHTVTACNLDGKYTLLGVYAEKVSGLRSKKRLAYLSMLGDCRKGRIDLILCKSPSRFGRNALEAITAIRELRDLNVEVRFEEYNIPFNDPRQEMYYTVFFALFQEESRQKSENTNWGLARRMESGECGLYNRPCYGYKKNELTGKLEVYEPEAKVVRKVFAWNQAGLGSTAIVKLLAQEEIKSPRGKSVWNPKSIIEMLNNEKYHGDVVLGKTYTKDYLSKQRVKNHGERRMYKIEGNHERIVERTVPHSAD